VDTWLMSCRVLNRRVEDAVLNHVAAAARAAGAKALRGTYIPTDRNGIVADLFQRLGFSPLPAEAGSYRWELDLTTFLPPEVPMTSI
jgi:predicted enzyme involved in methoxymalonyl-ACP biosynthesis